MLTKQSAAISALKGPQDVQRALMQYLSLDDWMVRVFA